MLIFLVSLAGCGLAADTPTEPVALYQPTKPVEESAKPVEEPAELTETQ